MGQKSFRNQGLPGVAGRGEVLDRVGMGNCNHWGSREERSIPNVSVMVSQSTGAEDSQKQGEYSLAGHFRGVGMWGLQRDPLVLIQRSGMSGCCVPHQKVS